MNGADERVERVLRAMGGEDAPEGMEARVLAGVRAVEAAPRWWVGQARWAVAAAAVVLVVGGVGVWERGAGGKAEIVPTRGGVAGRGEVARSAGRVAVPVVGGGVREVRLSGGGERVAAAMAVDHTRVVGEVVSGETEDERAMAAWRAPSQAAPAEALTGEERLLVAAAARMERGLNRRAVVAGMPPPVREAAAVTEAERAEAEAAYRRFFAPVVAPKQEAAVAGAGPAEPQRVVEPSSAGGGL